MQMHFFFLKNKKEDILKNCGIQTPLEPIYFHFMDKKGE